MAKVIMPFGKYKGENVEDITDIDYLQWATENCTLSDDLFTAIENQLENLL